MREMAQRGSRGAGFIGRFPLAFLTYGASVVTCGGFELTALEL